MALPTISFVTPGAFGLPSMRSSSVERVVENIAPQLAGSARVTIYGRKTSKLSAKGRLGGARCLRYPAKNKLRYIRAVLRSLRRCKPDIIVVENRPKHVLRIRKQHPDAQIWLNLHSNTFIREPYIRPYQLQRALQSASRIIVNSDFLRGQVVNRYPETETKLRVVHLGVQLQRFPSRFTHQGSARRAALRMQRGWEQKQVVMFMGRLIPKKGVHHLLTLLPELARYHPDLLLVIVGSAHYGSHRETAYTKRLYRLAKPYSKQVRFVPYVPYNQVSDWFLAADIAVVPSDKEEAFGLVNVEAMACGLPVVATKAGGIMEIVADGMTGFLAEPRQLQEELSSRLSLLLSNPALREEMGHNSRQRVEQHFTWGHSAEAWKSLLDEFALDK